MGKIKLLSLFSGIGAFEKALTNQKIEFDIVNYCEIDKYAAKCYAHIHNVSEKLNLGDITQVNIDNLPKNIDLLTHGSPCQDFSVSGKNMGGDEDSHTRSSLMWYSVRIISQILPKYVVWENVPNVLSKRHIHNFKKYLSVLNALGYDNQYNIFNSKDFGLPQNRDRIFVVSIRNDVKNSFDINKVNPHLPKTILKDFLCDDVKEDRYICKRQMKPLTSNVKNDIITIGQVSTKSSQAGKVYSMDGIFPTVCACTHGYAIGYVYRNNQVQLLTPKETFLLMGFSKDNYEKCKNLNMSNTQLYKMSGNSICVPILEYIFKQLIK